MGVKADRRVDLDLSRAEVGSEMRQSTAGKNCQNHKMSILNFNIEMESYKL